MREGETDTDRPTVKERLTEVGRVGGWGGGGRDRGRERGGGGGGKRHRER